MVWFFQVSCPDVRVGQLQGLSTEELIPLNCGAQEDSLESLRQQEIKPVSPKGNQH